MSGMSAIHAKLKFVGVFDDVFPNESQQRDSMLEFVDYNFPNYVLIGNEVWEKSLFTELDDCGFIQVINSSGGAIEFVALYSNGGACFDEIAEEAIRRG